MSSLEWGFFSARVIPHRQIPSLSYNNSNRHCFTERGGQRSPISPLSSKIPRLWPVWMTDLALSFMVPYYRRSIAHWISLLFNSPSNFYNETIFYAFIAGTHWGQKQGEWIVIMMLYMIAWRFHNVCQDSNFAVIFISVLISLQLNSWIIFFPRWSRPTLSQFFGPLIRHSYYKTHLILFYPSCSLITKLFINP